VAENGFTLFDRDSPAKFLNTLISLDAIEFCVDYILKNSNPFCSFNAYKVIVNNFSVKFGWDRLKEPLINAFNNFKHDRSAQFIKLLFDFINIEKGAVMKEGSFKEICKILAKIIFDKYMSNVGDCKESTSLLFIILYAVNLPDLLEMLVKHIISNIELYHLKDLLIPTIGSINKWFGPTAKKLPPFNLLVDKILQILESNISSKMSYETEDENDEDIKLLKEFQCNILGIASTKSETESTKTETTTTETKSKSKTTKQPSKKRKN